MAETLLDLEHGTLSLGGQTLVREARFSLRAGERVALVGPNGVGKTSFFRALAGELAWDEGRIWRRSLFLLRQEEALLEGTVWQAAYAVTPLARLDEMMAQSPPERLAELWDERRQLAVWRGKTARLLRALGLSPEIWAYPARELSPGQGVRLGLARALLSNAEILLLDEPTVYLDLPLRLRLEGWLKAYPGAIGLISHDRALLQAVATSVYHLEGGLLQHVPGGFAVYLAERERIRRTAWRAFKEAAKERERLLSSARQVAAWAPKSESKSRQKEVLLQRRDRLAMPQAPLERRWSLEFAATEAPRLLLEARELRKAYGREVLRRADLRIFRGDRIGLIGPNGTGKTTLIRLLLGLETPDGGVCRLSAGVTVAYLDQRHHGLDPSQGLWDQLARRFGPQQASALLGRVGFRPPRWFDPPSRFSQGEQARAGLALLMGYPAALLILDEPTNFLELELLEALERALRDYPGTLLFVTHDRALLEAVATRYWGLEEGVLVEYPSYREAEAALLGRPALRLDPLGQEVLLPEPLAEDPEAAYQALLERLEEPLLTRREEARLRAELRALEARLYPLWAKAHYLPPRHRWRSVEAGVEVFADEELTLWRFWTLEDHVVAELREGVLELEGPVPLLLLMAIQRMAREILGVGLRWAKR